jgi:hypothetical protein
MNEKHILCFQKTQNTFWKIIINPYRIKSSWTIYQSTQLFNNSACFFQKSCFFPFKSGDAIQLHRKLQTFYIHVYPVSHIISYLYDASFYQNTYFDKSLCSLNASWYDAKSRLQIKVKRLHFPTHLMMVIWQPKHAVPTILQLVLVTKHVLWWFLFLNVAYAVRGKLRIHLRHI